MSALAGMFFHSWRDRRADDKHATVRNGRVLEWQGRVVRQADGDRYLVELLSWWDGLPNGQKLVAADEMSDWTFYDDALEMQTALGCLEVHRGCTDPCGGAVTHYFDHRREGLGIYLLCSGCVKRYPGFRDATPLQWRDGKPRLAEDEPEVPA